MSDAYTIKNLDEIEDQAPKHGLEEFGEARFARTGLDAEQTGVTLHRLRAGKRQAFGHRHNEAEEIYVVLSGSGRVKLDDEIVDVAALDAIRVATATARAFEAGADGLEILVFGPHPAGDGEMLQGWWTD